MTWTLTEGVPWVYDGGPAAALNARRYCLSDDTSIDAMESGKWGDIRERVLLALPRSGWRRRESAG